ncbi:RNA polymerase II subunit 5-mediating protein-like protein [Triticum urartu]|uniref:RNA polymerase II subunit 5-mediating protein-like protein n=1 Tax=Triticum urartu TaxID=4572 RepID=M7ZHR7_TRIUA|nr:RNA polymerase II subunit 5-mediating protein homolog [Triticum urartu]XP_048565833.1 RNA polymerase II subunit 5-mediating protein homolog [Triticum urartu]EMS59612.1 RNA polymerase II subunit 5-mediating protein-like protein [Triticum urartu]
MATAKKGTATPLASAFSPEETRRAVSRVAQAIADRRADLARIQGFFADNAALVNLVQRLPDELSHQIMVPFGGAAFFPGSLIHTNELLVLLGDGYYADRSAKQTTEILHRRGMELEAQMEAIKATISDLEAEAKFFESTAAEASEGLVEIREEYDEEDTEIISSKTEASSSSGGISDEEHARMMARFDELEMLEKEAGSTSEDEGDDDDDDGDDEDAGTSEDGEENGETLSYGNEHDNVSFGASVSGSGGNGQSQGNAQLKSALKKLGEKETLQGSSLAPSGSTSITNSEVQASLRKAVSFKDENGQIVSSSRYSSGPKVSSSRDRQILPGGQKAFTGSIVEHDEGLSVIEQPRSNDSEKPASSASSSRPMSRFKMQKGGR